MPRTRKAKAAAPRFVNLGRSRTYVTSPQGKTFPVDPFSDSLDPRRAHPDAVYVVTGEHYSQFYCDVVGAPDSAVSLSRSGSVRRPGSSGFHGSWARCRCAWLGLSLRSARALWLRHVWERFVLRGL